MRAITLLAVAAILIAVLLVARHAYAEAMVSFQKQGM